MAKINHKEYEILKDLDNGWRWVARDENNSLWAYSKEPDKKLYGWLSLAVFDKELDKERFQFIRWEDEEPYNIAELIEEYESENGMRYDIGKTKVVDIDTNKLAISNDFFYVKESEETEVKKDIEWVKKQIDLEIIDSTDRDSHFYVDVGLKTALGFLNQLDEPEVLSSDWIRDNVEYAYYMTPRGTYSSAKAVIDPGKLQNLLVPDPELPVIPKFVADYIKWYENSFIYTFDTDTEYIIYLLEVPLDFTESERVKEWRDKSGNAQKLIDAYRWGYEVEEEEPKYNVEIKSSFGTVGIFLFKQGDEVLSGDNFKAYCPKEDEFRLTEQEIRGFQNGDVLFEHFAVKVEELEE